MDSASVSSGSGDIFEHLHRDHEYLAKRLHQLIATAGASDGEFDELKAEIEGHLGAEEEMLYARLEERGMTVAAEGRRQHAAIGTLLGAINGVPRGTVRRAAALRELEATVRRHFAYEESTVFAAARRVLAPAEISDLVSRVVVSETDKKASAAEPHMLAKEEPHRS